MRRRARISLASHFLYGLGDWMYSLAVVILAYQLSGRLAAAAGVLLFQAGGRLAGIAISPEMSDASRAARISRWLGTGRAVLIASLIFVSSQGQLWFAFVIAALVGLSSPTIEGARRALSPAMLPPGHRRNLRSRLIRRWDQIAMVAGSIAGGLVVVLWNEQAAFGAAGLMSLAAALVLPGGSVISQPTGSGGLRAGQPADWQPLRHLRAFRTLLLALAGGAALGVAIRVLLVEIVLESHDSSVLMYGLFIALAGAGAFAGPLSVPRLLGKLPSEIVLSGVTTALAIALIAIHLAEPLPLVIPIIIGCGILAITGERAVETIIRRVVPDRELDGALRSLAIIAIAGQAMALVFVAALDYLSGITYAVLSLTLVGIFCAAIPILVYMRRRLRSIAPGDG